MSDMSIPHAALALIEKKTGQDLSNWAPPKVTVEDKVYKVEWYPPEALPWSDEAVLTVYSNGEWDLYALDGTSYSGSVMRFHDRRWIRRLMRNGLLPKLAKSSWMYFKQANCIGRREQ